MSKITTELCKEYLVKVYPETTIKEWKRTSKYKDENKIVCREFIHSVLGTIILEELNGILRQKEKQVSQNSSSILVKNITNQEIEKSFEDNNLLIAYQPQFSNQELKVLKKYRRFLTWDDLTEEEEQEEQLEDDEFIEKMVNEMGNALPHAFDFFFTYGEDGSDTKVTHLTKIKNFSIFIRPTKSDFDQHCGYLVERFLPIGFAEDMECTFSATSGKQVDNKSALWLYKKMINLGFIPVFGIKGQEGIYMDAFKDIQIVPINNNQNNNQKMKM